MLRGELSPKDLNVYGNANTTALPPHTHTSFAFWSAFDPIVNLQLHFPILYSRRVSSRGFASAATTAAAAAAAATFVSAPVRTRGGVTGEERSATIAVVACFGVVNAGGVDGGEAAAAAATVADVVAAAVEARPEEEGEGTDPARCGMLLLPLLLPHDLSVSSTISLRFSRHCLPFRSSWKKVGRQTKREKLTKGYSRGSGGAWRLFFENVSKLAMSL